MSASFVALSISSPLCWWIFGHICIALMLFTAKLSMDHIHISLNYTNEKQYQFCLVKNIACQFVYSIQQNLYCNCSI